MIWLLQTEKGEMCYRCLCGRILFATFPSVQYSLALFWLTPIWKDFILTEAHLTSLSFSAAYPPSLLSQSTVCTAIKEKHITQQLSIQLSFLSPPLCVFVRSSSSALAPAFYTSLRVLLDGNRQLLKASMKCQHALCVDPILSNTQRMGPLSTSPQKVICVAFTFPLLAHCTKIICTVSCHRSLEAQ